MLDGFGIDLASNEQRLNQVSVLPAQSRNTVRSELLTNGVGQGNVQGYP